MEIEKLKELVREEVKTLVTIDESDRENLDKYITHLVDVVTDGSGVEKLLDNPDASTTIDSLVEIIALTVVDTLVKLDDSAKKYVELSD